MRAATSRFQHDVRPGFGVLLLRDQLAPAEHVDRLRLSAMPTWTATTELELLWLLEHGGARPSLVLVDLRPVPHPREARVADLASLASAAELPTILIGAAAHEVAQFTHVVAALGAGVSAEFVDDVVHRCV